MLIEYTDVMKYPLQVALLAETFRGATQVMHAFCPVKGWYLPAAQLKHAFCPLKGWYLPVAHLRHMVLLVVALKYPGAHRRAPLTVVRSTS